MSLLSVLMMFMSVLTFKVGAVDVPDVSAKGAILIEPLTGNVVYEKNAYAKLPMASTTKIMSAMLALEFGGDLDEQFVVDSEAIKVEGSSMGLQEGDTVTMRALVCGMLLPSGNDAANAAAVRISGSVQKFVQLMNERAAEIGMTSTHFVTPSGLDDDTDEHYSTAYDMALLTREAMKNPEFRDICSKSSVSVMFGNPPYKRTLTNTNKLLNKCEGVVGVKTGFTDKAKRCLVSECERDGAQLICVTLNAPDDWNDHEKLYDYGFEQFEERELSLPDNDINLNVVGGEVDAVKCTADKVSLKMLRNANDDIRSEVYLDHFIYAPVAEGVKVGSVRYYYGEQVISEQPIYTSEVVNALPVHKKSWWESVVEKLKLSFS